MNYLPLLGRICIAAIFLMSAFGKVTNFEGTKQYMASAGLPFTGFLLICAIVMLIIGGLFILIGYQAKFGAWVLIFFMIVATLVFHNNLADQTEMIAFLKNLAVIGGLIFVAHNGSGPISVDKNKK